MWGWYNDDRSFAPTSRPWFLRGGRAGGSATVGIFAFYNYYGGKVDSYSARVILSELN